jgi:hypothetical protein
MTQPHRAAATLGAASPRSVQDAEPDTARECMVPLRTVLYADANQGA